MSEFDFNADLKFNLILFADNRGDFWARIKQTFLS